MERDEAFSRTLTYYTDHAEEFVANTAHLNVDHLYAPFLAQLPPGARILDAGCGSGRDALAFKNLGYLVTAFDACPRLVEISSKATGLDVRLLTFQEMDYEAAFDGIWACASLLHVPRSEIREVLTRLQRALVPGGVLKASLKWGDREEFVNGRWFNFYDEDSFTRLIQTLPGWTLLRLWETTDIRPETGGQKWLNVLMRRTIP